MYDVFCLFVLGRFLNGKTPCY